MIKRTERFVWQKCGAGYLCHVHWGRICTCNSIDTSNAANDKTNKLASTICQLQTKTYSRRFSVVLVVPVFSSCFFSSSCCCFALSWCFVVTFHCCVASFCCSVATCCCCAATCCCCVATCWCCVAYCWACIAANCCWATYCCCAAVVVQYGWLWDKIKRS